MNQKKSTGTRKARRRAAKHRRKKVVSSAQRENQKFSIIFAAIAAAGGKLKLDRDVLNQPPYGKAYRIVEEDGELFIRMDAPDAPHPDGKVDPA